MIESKACVSRRESLRYSFRPLGGAFVALALFLFLFPAPPAPAQDGAFASCIRALAEQDLAGKTAFQEAVRDLIAAQKPEFEPLASLHMAHQIALAQVRAAQLAYLLAHDPGRIDAGSLSKFRNFDWSAADDAAVAAQDPEAGRLLARVAELRKKNDGHPDWPRLREFVRDELSPGPAFRALIADLSVHDRAVRKGLKNCRRE